MGVPAGTASTRSCWGVGSGSWNLVTVSSGCSMTFLARVSGESCGDDPGGDHEDEGYGDEGERRAPGTALRADIRMGRVHEALRRQRGASAAEHVPVRREYRQDGTEQRSRIT